MKKAKIIFLIFMLLLCFTGCKTFGASEINKTIFASVIAIDLPEDDSQNVKLTFSSETMQSSGGKSGGSTGKTSNILSSKGRTILEAASKLNSASEKKIFYGQMEYILVGEEAAKKNILNQLDIFERDYEIRLNAVVIIVRGGTAEEVLREAKTSDNFISDKLKSLFNNRDKLSVSDHLDQTDVMEMFDNKYMSAYIPCIHLVKVIERDKEKDKDKFDIKLDGYAVFKETSLLGYLLENDGRGLNWIRGRVDSGYIVVKNFYGENISLDIIDSSVNIIPKFDGEQPNILIKLEMSSNVDEILSGDDVFDNEHFDYFKRQQEEIIKKEIEGVIKYAQDNNADFIEICNVIHHKAPLKWNKIKEQWSKIFPDIKISVEIRSNINRTYDIKEPTRSRRDKKQ